ncbi:hypothetical protein D3C75_821240 [compost metagenome]
MKRKSFTLFAALLVTAALSTVSASASGDIVPTMTSNTTYTGTGYLGGYAYASSEWAFHEAYKAFDDDNSTYWSTSSGSYGELHFQLFGVKKVTSYTLRTSSQDVSHAPKDWTFEGFNLSEGKWVVLDQVSGYLSYPNYTHTRTFPNTKNYDRYRIKVTANNGAYSTSIAEVQMFE